MRIGLIDVDGHNFPNLALMRISAYHKAMGDTVEWWWSDFIHYDIVYMSKIFSDEYSRDMMEPINADLVIKGGTGYHIHMENGIEAFDRENHRELPPEIERMKPDYSIYPQYSYAVSMTSRGCPRGCPFCHVAAKEGRCSVKVADVSNFWNGQKEIQVLDPNITACKDKRELFRQYRVYMSKIFSDEYSRDMMEPINADLVIKGGTGYHIHMENGIEAFDRENHRCWSQAPDGSGFLGFCRGDPQNETEETKML